jgi:predicted alpha/beta-hydrolase family hydrolase
MTEHHVTFGSGLNGIVDGAGTRGQVIITHGSGRGMDSTILVKTAQRLADSGFRVLRFNFDYLGKRPAPSAGGKNELPELLAAMDYVKAYGEPILIGKSFGARVCANAAVEHGGVRGLAFYGMPLQGMSKSSKPRDWSHLARIAAPMLFITGNRDQLCPLDSLSEVLKTIKAPVTSEVVPGDHSFKPKSEDVAVAICVSWVEGLVPAPNVVR